MTNIKDYLVGQIPLIRPISVLRNTTEVTELCHQGMRPLFLTKNGYGDMVIMSYLYRKTKGLLSCAFGEGFLRDMRQTDGACLA